MTIAYYTSTPFPDKGMASGHRIRHLTQAISKAGVKCVVLTAFSDNLKIETMKIGDVEYRSLCDVTGRLQKRFAFYVLYPLRAYLYLRGLKKQDAEVVLCSYTSIQLQMWWAIFISKILHCPICREGTELPYSVINHAPRLKQFFEVNLALKFYDGFVSITHALYDYYSKKGRKGAKHIYIPMTVDCDRFDNANVKSTDDYQYIAYTGTMRREGGGVDVLAKAFEILSKQYHDMHLLLVGGDGDDKVKSYLSSLVEENTLRRIHFRFDRKTTNDEMTAYIKNAKILAMLPLPTKQQEGCFPTKLGEYLASGVPSVVSNVGVPPKYLTDKVNVRFVTAGDPAETAAVFTEILENYEEALRIADAGKIYARKIFHYENYGGQLVEWYKAVIRQ